MTSINFILVCDFGGQLKPHVLFRVDMCFLWDLAAHTAHKQLVCGSMACAVFPQSALLRAPYGSDMGSESGSQVGRQWHGRGSVLHDPCPWVRVYERMHPSSPRHATKDQGPGARGQRPGSKEQEPRPGAKEQVQEYKDQGPRGQGPGTIDQGSLTRDHGPGTQ